MIVPIGFLIATSQTYSPLNFEHDCKIHTYSFTRTENQILKILSDAESNPSSVILSGVMMLEYMGWQEAADLIVKGIEGAIGHKKVTYDFHRLMEGAEELKCSEFGHEIVSNMG